MNNYIFCEKTLNQAPKPQKKPLHFSKDIILITFVL